MRDLVATCRGEWPNTSICPLVGYRRPSSSLTVVDLPEPFGPSKPKTSPRRTSKSTRSTATALGRPQKSLKIFVRPRTTTTFSSGRGSRVAEDGIFSSTAVIGHFGRALGTGTDKRARNPRVAQAADCLSVAVQIFADCSNSLGCFLLPLPTPEEWGEDRGEGRLLSPALCSIGWRRGSESGCGASRAVSASL